MIKEALYYQRGNSGEEAEKELLILEKRELSEKEKEEFVKKWGGSYSSLFCYRLSESFFYPEGGGQPCDRGSIAGAKLLFVEEKDGELWQYTEADFPEGAKVRCQFDTDFRRWQSENHSAEHIFSGLVSKRFSYKNSGFHMECFGENPHMTVDFDGEFSEKELEELEQGVNAVIRKNLPIREIYLEGEEDRSLERKDGSISFRQKKALEGDIRIIEIPEVDSCACCGTHLSFTGEIGVFTILSYEKHRKGCRLTMLAGELAFLALEKKLKLLSGFAQSLSRPWTEIPEAFRSLQEKIFEKEEEKRGILEAGIRLLEEKILKELEEQRKGIKMLFLGSPLKDSCFSYYGKNSYLFLYLSELGMKDLQKICERLRLSLPLSLICLGKKEEGFSVVAGSREEDMRAFGKLLGEKLSFRGGGQKEMIQGSTTADFQEINAFIERIL
ncbi:alanyl-tRNA editing protein [uncultured Oribacterium sp.]|uniref:alanyl-tRNA editing protein n=1 Tax=uncultured Oribacterium sp. TaxID=462198 RepID=UPI002805F5E7|nr:alanyl-tRNA editing protein [uncultured Oribacterium sp.]